MWWENKIEYIGKILLNIAQHILAEHYALWCLCSVILCFPTLLCALAKTHKIFFFYFTRHVILRYKSISHFSDFLCSFFFSYFSMINNLWCNLQALSPSSWSLHNVFMACVCIRFCCTKNETNCNGNERKMNHNNSFSSRNGRPLW